MQTVLAQCIVYLTSYLPSNGESYMCYIEVLFVRRSVEALVAQSVLCIVLSLQTIKNSLLLVANSVF